MKKIINSILFLALFGSQHLFAQEQPAVFCESKQYIFGAKKVDGLGTVYTINNRIKNNKDTILISQADYAAKYCLCNDSIVAFYIEDYPSPKIKSFRIVDGSWKYINSIPLPPKFPPVGMLKDGEKYEKYKHTLIAPDKVISELTVMQANNKKQQLIPLEKYEVEFSVNLNTASLLIERKTAKE